MDSQNTIISYNFIQYNGRKFFREEHFFLLFTRFHNFSWLISEIIGKSKMLILGQKFNHKNPPKTEIHENYLTQILQLFLEYYLVYYLVWRYYNSYFYFSIRHTKMVGPYFILNHRPGPSDQFFQHKYHISNWPHLICLDHVTNFA